MAQEQIIRNFYDAVNRKDVESFISTFTEDGEFRDISSEKTYRGKNELRQMAEMWLKAFPDLNLQVSNIIGSGDNFSVEIQLTGTQKGQMNLPQATLPPTNKKVNVPSCDVIRVRNGKIQSVHCYFAATVMLNQLGAMPKGMAA